MNETQYHKRADATLAHIAEALEAAYDSGSIEDIEQSDAVLTITSKAGHTWVVSKHSPTRQIWLASRLGGGLHFSFHAESGEWRLADQRSLYPVLQSELAQRGITVAL